MGPAPSTEIDRAVQVLRSAKRPALLIGVRGAGPDACAAVRALLATSDLPVVETFQAAGVVSRKLEEHYLGRVGLFRNQPGDVIIDHADVVVTIGYDPVEYDPGLWNVDASRQIIHVDSNPAQIDNHYQPTVQLRGDVSATVTAIAEQMGGRLTPSADFLEEIALQRRTLADIDAQAHAGQHGPSGLNPADVILHLRDSLDDGATITCDIGSNYIYMARHMRVYQPRHLLFSNGQQTLGVALPWAIAASLTRSGEQVVSVSGDGGFLFSAMELETAVRVGAPFTHIILRDNTYDMVRFQQLLKYGRTSGITLGDYDIVHYAKAFGANGYRVESIKEFVATLEQALAERGPSIIDVPVDYTHNTELYAQIPGDPFE